MGGVRREGVGREGNGVVKGGVEGKGRVDRGREIRHLCWSKLTTVEECACDSPLIGENRMEKFPSCS